jgi:hypothetical protein
MFRILIKGLSIINFKILFLRILFFIIIYYLYYYLLFLLLLDFCHKYRNDIQFPDFWVKIFF